MKTRCLLVVCLLGALAILIAPPVDVPETAFNEMDLPVLVARPASLPSINTIPVLVRAEVPLQSMVLDVKPLRVSINVAPHPARSLQPLLCVFLI